jgi:hypothetical protein
MRRAYSCVRGLERDGHGVNLEPEHCPPEARHARQGGLQRRGRPLAGGEVITVTFIMRVFKSENVVFLPSEEQNAVGYPYPAKSGLFSGSRSDGLDRFRPHLRCLILVSKVA